MPEVDDRALPQVDFPAIAHDAVTTHETHTAWVFLLGEVAYKMKKPIRTDFLDFTTLDSRWWACEREHTLNSRFAPDIYLGIAELPDLAGGPGEPLLKMRRLPDSARLTTLASKGVDLSDQLDTIARTVSSVHRSSIRTPAIDHEGTRDAVRQRWHANFREIRSIATDVLDGRVIDELQHLVDRFLAGRSAVFDTRIAQGRIVDGHGDLLADDIFCMTDGPRILDCLDFDDHLRYVDGIDDAACLAMDLEFQGRVDAAREFMSSYIEAAADAPPTSLIDHYVAYRAMVRAKVACIRFLQGSTDSKIDAATHLALAIDHMKTATITLTLVGGLPGTGKSTLAAALATHTGDVVLSSDVVRKELAGIDALDPHRDEFGRGLYTASNTSRTYTELLRRARTHLVAGQSVVIDASWSDPDRRERAELLAASTSAHLVELECTAPAQVSIDRIAHRPRGASDATRSVYESMADRRAPWPQATTVNTTEPAADVAALTLKALHSIT